MMRSFSSRQRQRSSRKARLGSAAATTSWPGPCCGWRAVGGCGPSRCASRPKGLLNMGAMIRPRGSGRGETALDVSF